MDQSRVINLNDDICKQEVKTLPMNDFHALLGAWKFLDEKDSTYSDAKYHCFIKLNIFVWIFQTFMYIIVFSLNMSFCTR